MSAAAHDAHLHEEFEDAVSAGDDEDAFHDADSDSGYWDAHDGQAPQGQAAADSSWGQPAAAACGAGCGGGGNGAVWGTPAAGGVGDDSGEQLFPLHSAAFNNRHDLLVALVAAASTEQLKQLDTQGNTALHVALLRRHRECVRVLLEGGAPCTVRNARGWEPLFEAVQQQDRHMALLVARTEVAQRRAEVKAKKLLLVDTLKQLPDLTLQLSWDLDSSVPGVGLLLRRYAPHDTYTLWKRGTMLRIDGSLMGLDSKQSAMLPAWKRGHFSLLYDGRNVKHRVWFVNHKKREYWDVKELHKHVMHKSEASSIEEEVDALMARGVDQVMVTKMKTSEFKFVPLAGWFKSTVTEKVEGWQTQVFDISGKITGQGRIKAPLVLPPNATFADYLAAPPPPPDACVAQAVRNPLSPKSSGRGGSSCSEAGAGYGKGGKGEDGGQCKANGTVSGAASSSSPQQGEKAAAVARGTSRAGKEGGKDGGNGGKKGATAAMGNAAASTSAAGEDCCGTSSKQAGHDAGAGAAAKKPKRFKGRCWMAEEFPMSLQQLLPLLDVIGTANKHMAKAAKFMSKFGKMAMFPVKVRVPLAMTVYAHLSFKQFKVLDAKGVPEEAFFDVPAGFKKVDINEPGRLKHLTDDASSTDSSACASRHGAHDAVDEHTARKLAEEELVFDD